MSIDKVVESAEVAVADVIPGASLAVGGFGLVGISWTLIAAVLDQGADDLTVVSNNCGADRVVTDLGVLDVAGDGFELVDLAPGVTADELLARTDAPVRVPVGV